MTFSHCVSKPLTSENKLKNTRKSGDQKFRLITFLFVLGCFGVSAVQAWQKNIHFEHLTTDQGLSHVFVHSITQDQQGFMWFGTANGLNKFDGHEVTVFKNDPDDSNSISKGPVTALLVDHEGVLWAGDPDPVVPVPARVSLY